MRLDIARQPLFPALITLIALTATAVSRYEGFVVTQTIQAASSATFPLPGELLTQLQTTHPLFSKILAGVLIIISGMTIGRLSIRYSLYATPTCLAIPLFGVVICGVTSNSNYLAIYTASALLAFAVQKLCQVCRSGYNFDSIFAGAIYLGLMPFVYTPALPLVLLLPLSVIVFRASARELVAGIAGMLLPTATICYIGWGCGYDFSAPLLSIKNALSEGAFLDLFRTTPQPILYALAAVGILCVSAILMFLSNAYASGNKPRFILIFNIGVLLIAATLPLLPAANSGILALLAIPISLALPMLFIRLDHNFSTILYLLLLAAGVVGALLY